MSQNWEQQGFGPRWRLQGFESEKSEQRMEEIEDAIESPRTVTDNAVLLKNFLMLFHSSKAPVQLNLFKVVLLGCVILAFWGLAISGIKHLIPQLRGRIELDPNGRSQVPGPRDRALYNSAILKLGFCTFSLSMGLLTATIFIDPYYNLAGIICLAILAILLVKVLIFWGQTLAKSTSRYWRIALDREGFYRTLSLAMFPIRLLVRGMALVVISLTILVIFINLLFLLYMFWGDHVFLMAVLYGVTSLGMMWIVYDLTQHWIQSRIHFVCQTCQADLLPVAKEQVEDGLTQPQTVAQQLGSTSFQGLNCPNCTPILSHFHLRRYRLVRDKFEECPNCQELTVTSTTEVLVHVNRRSPGLQQMTFQCQACDYSKSISVTVPSKYWKEYRGNRWRSPF
ncbi:hypothetical protein [Sodalinema gerasimenkoae]|uniref:hypothetical protein n=1 Tax=Sodalinema gerasimenkoae TaxID=2862348 RepID=UPI00135AEE61|nr:hypothetical protein [Sodalinema gerasimenkoae]